uniref:Uncharacterized protein n=1 Tax=Cacopsylla melanoneura TaxID=428564 RepID=A0A8D8TSL0_9HEMI
MFKLGGQSFGAGGVGSLFEELILHFVGGSCHVSSLRLWFTLLLLLFFLLLLLLLCVRVRYRTWDIKLAISALFVAAMKRKELFLSKILKPRCSFSSSSSSTFNFTFQ